MSDIPLIYLNVHRLLVTILITKGKIKIFAFCKRFLYIAIISLIYQLNAHIQLNTCIIIIIFIIIYQISPTCF